MKKYGILITLMVLTATLLAGCRRPAAAPTELPPTQGATLIPTTEATTVPTTMPMTEAPTETMDTATGDAETETGMAGEGTEATAPNRSRMPGVN